MRWRCAGAWRESERIAEEREGRPVGMVVEGEWDPWLGRG